MSSKITRHGFVVKSRQETNFTSRSHIDCDGFVRELIAEKEVG